MMRRTRPGRFLTGGALLAAVSIGTVATATSDGTTVDTAPAVDAPTDTVPSSRRATVERRDLTHSFDAVGSLTYGERRTITGPGAGTITKLPAPGTEIRPDEPLYRIDDRPGPIRLPGAVPMWRTLEPGVDDGADVRQLEAALAYMGFGDDDLTIDEEFTYSTVRAVKRWQESHGIEPTGRVELGDVWFTDEDIRIAEPLAHPGDAAEGDILTITGVVRTVVVDLDARRVVLLHEGDTVGLEFADGTSATGTVGSVADTATVTEGPDGAPESATIRVTIVPDRPVDTPDESPVTVRIETAATEDALTVPVDAVVAVAGGRYAVEVIENDGSTALVEVRLGDHADGWVQIDGDVDEGDTVVTA